jgi:uncharacterized protein YecE (DUF72 family)
MAREHAITVGTAGWSLRREHQHLFESGQTHLAGYATRLSGVEINSSFYRPHRPATYAKWAASMPPGFRFAVKVPRAITHEARLVGVEGLLAKFLSECSALDDKLGPLLIQLPPSLKFDAAIAGDFFTQLRAQTTSAAVIEPRHPGWFTEEAEALFHAFRIARVAVDPAPKNVSRDSASEPGGDRAVVYVRLHGSPRIYYSDYARDALAAVATRLRAEQRAGSDVWCIFDNTALGHATENALALNALLGRG